MQLASIDPGVEDHPFELLLDIERRSLRHELAEGRSKAAGAVWSGLGFRVGDCHLAVALEDVAEVVLMPQLTRVPGAKPWVRGIANLRGTVLTAVDFAGFLGLKRDRRGQQKRLLVLSANGWISGLVVDEVLGMRAFYEGDQAPGRDPGLSALRPYVGDAYRSDETVWHVFNPAQLLNDTNFLATAV